MVIYNDGNYQTLSTYPDDNFVELLECFNEEQKDNVLCVIPETTRSELTDKVKRLAPDFEIVYNENNEIIDITEVIKNE